VFLPSFVFGGLIVPTVSPQVGLAGAGVDIMLAAALGLTIPTLHRWRALDDAGALQPRASLRS